MIQRPTLRGNYQLQQYIELQDVFRYAWIVRRDHRSKRARWQAYEALKRRLDRVCGWSSRNPAVGPEDYDNAIRMLIRELGI
jgi:hypothetical protein